MARRCVAGAPLDHPASKTKGHNMQPKTKTFAIKMATTAICALAGAQAAHAQDPAPTAASDPAALAARLLARQQQLEQEVSDLKTQLQQVLAAQSAAQAQATAAAIPPGQTAETTPTVADSAFAANPMVDHPSKHRFVNTENTILGVYGILEVTLDTNSTGGPNAGPNTELASGGVINKRWTGLDRPWISANRWGIDLAHVLSKSSNTILIGRLESELELPTGNMDTPGTLFNRDAWLGVASPTIGKLTFGKQDSLARDVNMIWANPSPLAAANLNEGGWYDNQVVVQQKTYFESPTGSRPDAEIMWKKPWGKNFITYFGYQTAGLRNSQGGINDVVETGTFNEQEFAAGFGYNSSGDMFHLSGSYTYAKINGYKKSIYAAGGNILPAPWLRINAGYIGADIGQPSAIGDRHDDTIAASVMINPEVNPGPKFEYVLGYNYSHAHNAGLSGGTTLNPFDDTSGITSAANGTLGTAYALIYYHWDANTLFYVAADYSKQTGGFVEGFFDGHSSMNQLGVGARYVF